MDESGFCAWAEVGLVRVYQDGAVTRRSGGVFDFVHREIGPIAIERCARPLCSVGQTDAVIARLRSPGIYPEQRLDERERDDRIALASNRLDDVVERLHRYYCSRYAPSQTLFENVEQYVVSELAYVRDQNEHLLRRTLRAGHPAFLATAQRQPDDPSRPERGGPAPLLGYEYVGAFASDGELVLERPSQDGEAWTFAAERGTWHVYLAMPLPEYTADDLPLLMALHDSAVTGRAPQLAFLGKRGVGYSGQISIASAAGCRDLRFDGRLPDLPILTAHGCAARTEVRPYWIARGLERGGRVTVLGISGTHEA